MMTGGLTQHALTRMAQRSISNDDLELIMWLGTEVKDGYLVRGKDCEVVERQLKRLLDRVRRLDGKRVVVTEGRILTTYHACPAKQRHLLRHVERREIVEKSR